MTQPHAADIPEQKTILICDDEESLRELIRAVLGPDYRYLECEDGDRALELIRAESPDLVVLDVMLPRRNGLEVLAELRRDPQYGKTPVVVVTAWSYAVDAAAAAGADVFLPKPFEPDHLKGTVEELIG
jgi:two-component system cell cycle response regulator DivK